MNPRETNLKIINTAVAKVSDTMESENCICGHWIGCHTKAHVIDRINIERKNADYPCLHCVCKFFHAILGREAQLADVLLAIEKRSDINISQDKYPSGIIEIQAMLNEDEDRHIDWNLAAGGVEHQEDSTIAFIAELLK